jgi:hypothetical protein
MRKSSLSPKIQVQGTGEPRASKGACVVLKGTAGKGLCQQQYLACRLPYLERTLDLSFVRDFVQQTYAGMGRPSVDPVVFFKLQLVMFFEGIRSERQLMCHAADRLSIRWFLGYDLGEPLPDHSSLTRIRERYGVDIFRRFFDAIVEH